MVLLLPEPEDPQINMCDAKVSKFKKGEDIITQYMIESDHSYIFAEIDEGETTWKLLSRIPDEIIRQIDYLAWEEEGIAIP